ncbi:MAG: hypothetical protein QOE92_1676 [Chloroflexota bacterium]|jgi:hypothetical protein|nr:hypothetical protein [Chloroflexota bacterium]
MIGGASARQVVHGCIAQPPPDALLPMLALSVIATEVPFSATEVAGLAAQLAAAFTAGGAPDVAHRVVADVADGLVRCGALEQAADLFESEVLLRWGHRARGV